MEFSQQQIIYRRNCWHQFSSILEHFYLILILLVSPIYNNLNIREAFLSDQTIPPQRHFYKLNI